VVPTNAVKGCGIRHFLRLAMTRRMIRGEMWRTDRYKLWGECLDLTLRTLMFTMVKTQESRREEGSDDVIKTRGNEPSCRGG
jgi:hypothetical protein